MKSDKKKTKRATRLALILNVLDEEYQTSVFSGIKKRCQEKGVDIICFQNDNPLALENSLVTKLPGKEFFDVDGIILLSSVFSYSTSIHSKETLNRLWPDTPVISVGQKIEGIPSVSIRSTNSMGKLLDHLIKDHHYKKFLYMSGIDEFVDSRERKTVFEKNIQRYIKKNPAITYECFSGYFSEVASREIISQYIAENPDKPADVIVCANDNMALGVYKYLKSQNLYPKWDKCAVTGFDDIPQAALEIPAFTTVHQPLAEMGSKAIDIMMDTLQGKVIEESFVHSRLIIRESCGCKKTSSKTKTLTEKNFNNIQRKFFQSEHLLKLMSHWGQQLNSVTDTDELTYALDTNLSLLGIDNFALYSFPLSNSERKLSSNRFINKTNQLFLKQNGIRISPYGNTETGPLNQLLAKLSECSTNSLVVKILSSPTGITGFIVYDAPQFMHPNICSISTNIGQTIYRLQITEQQEKYSTQLEKAVEKRTKELIAENNKRIEVEAEVLKISEMERKRFSTDLHDDICQRLAGLAMLCRCYSSSEKQVSREQMVELTELITDTLQATRQYAHNSFPVDLDSLGMKDALSNLCNTFQTQSKCSCNYSWELPENKRFTQRQAITIFRIIQEALQNIMKHAQATEAGVIICKDSSEKNLITVTVTDNGKGISNAKNKKQGIGMKSMVYRADQIGACFSAEENKPQGTIIKLTLPEAKLEDIK